MSRHAHYVRFFGSRCRYSSEKIGWLGERIVATHLKIYILAERRHGIRLGRRKAPRDILSCLLGTDGGTPVQSVDDHHAESEFSSRSVLEPDSRNNAPGRLLICKEPLNTLVSQNSQSIAATLECWYSLITSALS